MSPTDAFAQSNGKTPITKEERLLRFQEEMDGQIHVYSRAGDHIFADALRVIKRAADHQSIIGAIDAAVDRIKEEGTVPNWAINDVKDIANKAAKAATHNTVLVPSPPKEEPRARHEEPEFTPPEPPKEPSKRERFYEAFSKRIANKVSNIGHGDASIQNQTKGRALRYATNFPNGDPTPDRIGMRILAWANGQVEGEESNKLDKNAAQDIYKIATDALKTAEQATGHSTEAHVEQVVAHIRREIENILENEELSNDQRHYLGRIKDGYALSAQKYTVAEELERVLGWKVGENAERDKTREILLAIEKRAHEQIDATEAEAKASAKAEFDTSAGDAKVNPSIETEPPARRTEPFKDLMAAKAEELADKLSQPQRFLLSAMQVNGCYEREVIREIADEHYGLGKIDQVEAEAIVEIATQIWAQTHGAEALDQKGAPAAEETQDTAFQRLLQDRINNASNLGLWPDQVRALKVVMQANPQTGDDIYDIMLKHHEEGNISENRANTVLKVANDAWIEVHNPEALKYQKAQAEHVTFPELIDRAIQSSKDLSQIQISLLETMKEKGCRSKFDILKEAEHFFEKGDIGYDEAWTVVEIAEAAWDDSTLEQNLEADRPRDASDGM